MKKKEKLRNDKKTISFLFNLLVIFTINFTLMLCAYISISMFVFEQFNLHFFYILIIFVASLVSSIAITLFIRINKISLILQVLVIYSIFAIMMIIVLSIFEQYILQHQQFFFVMFISSFLGLLVVIAVLLLMKLREEKDLNSELEKYKGRKH